MIIYRTRTALLLLACVLVSGCASKGTVPSHETNQSPGSDQNIPGNVPTGNGTGQAPVSGGDGSIPPGNEEVNNGDSGGSTGNPGTEEKPPVSSVSDSIQKQLAGMTLDEKLGEMIIAGVAGNTANDKTKRMIEQQHVGGIIFYKDNVTDPKGVVAYVNQLKKWNQVNKSPLFFSLDEEGGRVSRLPGIVDLPSGREVGKVNDRSYAGEIGSFLGEASSSMGFNMDFAPVLDINSNPKNEVIGDRSYGATAKLVTAMGMEVKKGIEMAGVISVVKHFPGHGDTAVDSHLELPIVKKSLKQLRAFEWLPFKEAIDEGSNVVMIAHILFPKLDPTYPASLSKTVITDELRGTLGFKGVIITDDLTMGAISKHFGMGEAAVLTIQAGSDILLVAHGYNNVDTILASLKKKIKSGDITEQRIDESVVRILQLKEKYRLSEETAVKPPNLTNLNKAISKAIASHK